MNDLNSKTEVRPAQILGTVAVTVLFLALLMASAIAGGATAKSIEGSGLNTEDLRRTAPRVTEPTDTFRKVQSPVVERKQAPVDVCLGVGLTAGSLDAAELRTLIQTYCYPAATFAGERVSGSIPIERAGLRLTE